MVFWHDLILADFGRQGTLRYLDEFSRAEREWITAKVKVDPFYDEHRLLRYTVIGALRDIKKDFLPNRLTAIDERILVGTSTGLSTSTILLPILETLLPHLHTALVGGADRVRVIVPCNTLHSVSVGLAELLSSPDALLGADFSGDNSAAIAQQVAGKMKAGAIEAPSVVRTVTAELKKSDPKKISVLGSQAAVEAYQEEVAHQSLNTSVESWVPDGFKDFGEVLQKAVRDLEHAAPQGAPEPGEIWLSGCTDFVIPKTRDSVAIFAKALVAEAYYQLIPSGED